MESQARPLLKYTNLTTTRVSVWRSLARNRILRVADRPGFLEFRSAPDTSEIFIASRLRRNSVKSLAYQPGWKSERRDFNLDVIAFGGCSSDGGRRCDCD